MSKSEDFEEPRPNEALSTEERRLWNARSARVRFGLDHSLDAIMAADRDPDASYTVRLAEGVALTPPERALVEAKRATYRTAFLYPAASVVAKEVWAGMHFDWTTSPAGEWVLHFTDDGDRWLAAVRSETGFPFPDRLRKERASFSLEQLEAAQGRVVRYLSDQDHPPAPASNVRIAIADNRVTVPVGGAHLNPPWVVALGPEVAGRPLRRGSG